MAIKVRTERKQNNKNKYIKIIIIYTVYMETV